MVLMPNLRSAAPNSTIEQANCTAYSRVGQFGEVAKLLLVLLHTSGGAPGSFVEIGAHDGITISNTLLLESCWGWTGLLVEADLSLPSGDQVRIAEMATEAGFAELQWATQSVGPRNETAP